jgi:indolepyruvate ferredoxin oxidoreductase alpha subunit
MFSLQKFFVSLFGRGMIMHTEFLMGNEAIALGALAAGIHLAAGYPGTPSTEVLETVARRSGEKVHVEWSTNEKAALEMAAGAAYSGARALVTMKQVGLNVAADPLMSLEYVGIKGGLVLMVADDPGPISSQTEQDTRTFAAFAKVPLFDPSTVAEAYEMIQEAFDLSEKYGTPVIFRATTRIDHGYESIEVKEPEEYLQLPVEGFVKDSSRWVIFPRLSRKNHELIEARNVKLSEVFSAYEKNELAREKSPLPRGKRRGIASAGISWRYALDQLGEGAEEVRRLKVATPFPFPEQLARTFLTDLDEVLCLEELDPVLERALTYVAGKYHLPVRIRGKLTGDMPPAGENTPAIVGAALTKFLEQEAPPAPKTLSKPPPQ